MLLRGGGGGGFLGSCKVCPKTDILGPLRYIP